jgi:hypothetical protein
VVIGYALPRRRRERRRGAENRAEAQRTAQRRRGGHSRRRSRRLCGKIVGCEDLPITTRAGHRPHPSEAGARRTMATGLRPQPIARRIRTTGRRIRTTARRTETNRRGPPQGGLVHKPTRHLTAPSAADFLLRGDALRLNRHAARRMRGRHNGGHARYRGVRDRFRRNRHRCSANHWR